MSVKHDNILQVVSGWQAVELFLKCTFLGIWQFLQITVKSLWKGYRRKSSKNYPPVELTVDSSIGTHCYIKIMGVKYHYVETGPKSGQVVLILGDVPDTGNLWSPTWSSVVCKLAQTGYHVITLDLRGTGGSEGGNRYDLSPRQVVEEMSTLMEALGVSSKRPAVVIGFGIGGILTWYVVHCAGSLVSKFIVVAAPHPNLYWQYPPTQFCRNALHFIQWPYFPERWLAEGGEGRHNTRACDWVGPLNYLRGAAWCRVGGAHRVRSAGLLVGAAEGAAQLVASAHYCLSSTLRLVAQPEPADREVHDLILDFLIDKVKPLETEPRGLMRMLGAVAGRGRELTARLVLPAHA